MVGIKVAPSRTVGKTDLSVEWQSTSDGEISLANFEVDKLDDKWTTLTVIVSKDKVTLNQGCNIASISVPRDDIAAKEIPLENDGAVLLGSRGSSFPGQDYEVRLQRSST